MKNILRLLFASSLLLLVSCGKKKCDSCPDWGKAETRTEPIEEA